MTKLKRDQVTRAVQLVLTARMLGPAAAFALALAQHVADAVKRGAR